MVLKDEESLSVSIDTSQANNTVIQFRENQKVLLGDIIAPRLASTTTATTAQFNYTNADNSDLNGLYTFVTTGCRKAREVQDLYDQTYQLSFDTANFTATVDGDAAPVELVLYRGSTYTFNSYHVIQLIKEVAFKSNDHDISDDDAGVSYPGGNITVFTPNANTPDTLTFEGKYMNGNAGPVCGTIVVQDSYELAERPETGVYQRSVGPEFYHIYVQTISNHDVWCCSKSNIDLTTINYNEEWVVEDLTINPATLTQFQRSHKQGILQLYDQLGEFGLDGRAFAKVAYGQRSQNSEQQYIYEEHKFNFNVTTGFHNGSTVFFVDGIPQKTLTLLKEFELHHEKPTYSFVQSDISEHRITFYSENQELTDYIIKDGNTTTIQIPHFLTSLTYRCENHEGMGGNIEIVDAALYTIYRLRPIRSLYSWDRHYVFRQNNKFYYAYSSQLRENINFSHGMHWNVENLTLLNDSVCPRIPPLSDHPHPLDASSARPSAGIQTYNQTTTLTYTPNENATLAGDYTLVALGCKHKHFSYFVTTSFTSYGIFEMFKDNHYYHIYFDSLHGWSVAQNNNSLVDIITSSLYPAHSWNLIPDTFTSPEILQTALVYFVLTADGFTSQTTVVKTLDEFGHYTVFVPTPEFVDTRTYTSVTMQSTDALLEITDFSHSITATAHFSVTLLANEADKTAILGSSQYSELCRNFVNQQALDGQSIRIDIFNSAVPGESYKTFLSADGTQVLNYVYDSNLSSFRIRFYNFLTHSSTMIANTFNIALNDIRSYVSLLYPSSVFIPVLPISANDFPDSIPEENAIIAVDMAYALHENAEVLNRHSTLQLALPANEDMIAYYDIPPDANPTAMVPIGPFPDHVDVFTDTELSYDSDDDLTLRSNCIDRVTEIGRKYANLHPNMLLAINPRWSGDNILLGFSVGVYKTDDARIFEKDSTIPQLRNSANENLALDFMPVVFSSSLEQERTLPTSTVITIETTQDVNDFAAYINVFNTSDGTYAFGFGYPMQDLRADSTPTTITLRPNTLIWTTEATNNDWFDQGTEEPTPNKFIEARAYRLITNDLGGHLTFEGTVTGFDLGDSYTTVAFIRAVDQQSTFVVRERTVSISDTGFFSVLMDVSQLSSVELTYGFSLTGPLASPDSTGSIVIGEVPQPPAATSSTGQALGDPYVYPMRTPIPVKLPNRAAAYCLYQSERTFINAEVRCATTEHQARMLQFVKDLGRETKRVIADGYFFSKFFVHDGSRDAQLMIDLRQHTMEAQGDHAFTISESTHPHGTRDWGGVARNVLIEWPVDQTVMKLTVSFYTNPHIENGISLSVESLPANAIGLLVHNYKPKLMRLRSLTTTDSQIIQRLGKAKKIMHLKDIKSRAEIWRH